MKKYDIPVTLFVFRRLDTVKLIFEKLQKVKPEKLYIFADGPREGKEGEKEKVEEVREFIISAVNWDCELIKCFSEKNIGYAKNIRDGFGKVLSENPYGIFLEDDAIPSGSFFIYCEQMLKKYQYNDKIQYVAGFNGIGDNNIIKESYTFGRTAPMSGAIATWADRWNNCDFELKHWQERKKKGDFDDFYYTRELRKISYKNYDEVEKRPNSEWDVQFGYDMMDKDRFAIVPKGNLANSYGYWEATHDQGEKAGKEMASFMSFTQKKFEFPMTEPEEISWNRAYDKERQRIYLVVNGNYIKRHMGYGIQAVKDFAYNQLPKPLWNAIKKIVKR